MKSSGNKAGPVLVVDDEKSIRISLREFLVADDYTVEVAADTQEAKEQRYLLMLANDLDSAHTIRSKLKNSPVNSRALFVDFSISQTGVQITRS